MSDSNSVQILVAHARQNHLTEPDLDELVHELKACEAADINNGGIEEQAKYIIDQLGPTEAMTRVDKLIS